MAGKTDLHDGGRACGYVRFRNVANLDPCDLTTDCCRRQCR
jgi:hypothetical protein